MTKTILAAALVAAALTGCRWDSKNNVLANCGPKDPLDKVVHSVPDAGNTLALLSLGVVALAAIRPWKSSV